MNRRRAPNRSPRLLGIAMCFPVALLFPASPAFPDDRPVVLFDEGHGQRFVVQRKGDLDLFRLAETIFGEGIAVKFRKTPLDAREIKGFEALVVSGPFAPFTEGEVALVEQYVRDGGRLAVMLHIGQPVFPLLEVLGVRVLPGVVHEGERAIGGVSTDFTVADLEDHPLHSGLETYSLYGAWGLEAPGERAKVIARTSPGAWLDTDRDRSPSPGEPAGPFGVAVAGTLGKGAFVVFRDDALFQNRFLRGSNRDLARNLARWLAGFEPE